MLDLLCEFLNHASLPAEANEYFKTEAKKLVPAFEDDCKLFTETIYTNGYNIRATEEMRKKLAEKCGINFYTLNFLLLIYAAKRMRADFADAGYSDELFFNTIMDMKYKIIECWKYHDVYGIFVEFWYGIFYSLDLFKLGRLEFQRQKYNKDVPYKFGDITINPGDTVIGVHIPSAGPLTEEGRIDSYKQAYKFFEKDRNGGPLVCVCSSWLLFKGNKDIFPAGLNIVKFHDDWDIVESSETETFGDYWRIFGKSYDGNPDHIPENTTQQKALKKWLTAGKKTGHGFGVLVFDGEKRINK